MRWLWLAGLAMVVAVAVSGCNGATMGTEQRQVVLYTSLNEPTARAVIDEFEKRTGIRVVVQADTERDKTVGLVRTLIEERNHPRADVFWNSEIANTIRLREAGVLEKLDPTPENAKAIPAAYRDPDGYWFGFAARARVFIVNTDLVPQAERPHSTWCLLDPKWRGKAGIVRPVTGTTLTHLTALYDVFSAEEIDRFFAGIVANECPMPAGNGRLAQLVGEGELAFGFTDTSDYRLVKNQGKPVIAVYPDQQTIGTMVLPNSVARIKGGPNPAEARELIEFLLSAEAEKILAFHPRGHIPLKPEVQHPEEVLTPDQFRVMPVDFERVGKAIEARLVEFDQRFR